MKDFTGLVFSLKKTNKRQTKQKAPNQNKKQPTLNDVHCVCSLSCFRIMLIMLFRALPFFHTDKSEAATLWNFQDLKKK